MGLQKIMTNNYFFLKILLRRLLLGVPCNQTKYVIYLFKFENGWSHPHHFQLLLCPPLRTYKYNSWHVSLVGTVNALELLGMAGKWRSRAILSANAYWLYIGGLGFSYVYNKIRLSASFWCTVAIVKVLNLDKDSKNRYDVDTNSRADP